MSSNIAVGFDGGGRRRHFGTMMYDGDYYLYSYADDVDACVQTQPFFFR